MRASTVLRLLLVACLIFSLLLPVTFAQSDDEYEDDEPGSSSSESAYADSGVTSGSRAKCIIHKRLITAIPGLFAAQRPINVSIVVYNVGTIPAHSLTISDNWGDLFDIIDGHNVTEVDVLDVGGVAELNFTVVPHKEGYFTGGAATVSYEAEGAGSRIQQAYSSGYKSFTIYPTDVYERYSRTKTFEWTVLGVGLAAVIGIPLAIWLNVQRQYEHGLPRQSKKTA